MILRLASSRALEKALFTAGLGQRGYASTPWYVSKVPMAAKAELDIEMPENAPPVLESVCKQLVAEYGLEELQVLDARERQTALGPAIMVVGTGKSVRHLGRATAELKAWLKHEHSSVASSEGTLTANFVRTWRRRTQRRQERQRSYAPKIDVDPTMQRKTGDWIVVDTGIEGIYVHLMTQDKREHLDWDTLLREEEPQDDVFQEYVMPAGSSGSSGIAGSSTRSRTRNFSTYVGPSLARTQVGLDLARNVGLNRTLDLVRKFSTAAPATATATTATAALRTINGAPLSDLVAAVESELIRGDTLKSKDLKSIFTAIAYYKYKHIEALPLNKQTVAEWRQICDEKARAILAVYNLVARPQGQSLLDNNDIVLLLWRAFVSPSSNSITPTTALVDPTPTRAEGFSDSRAVGFLQILADRGQYAHLHVLVPLLCGLLNSKSWGMFWTLLDKATITVDLPMVVVDPIIAMVVKSGNEKMIVHALTSFLPAIYRSRGFVASPELKRAITLGLEVIDPHKKGYPYLREFARE